MRESEPLIAWEGYPDGVEEAILGVLHPRESCRVAPMEWWFPAFAPFYPSTPPGVVVQRPMNIVVSDQAVYLVGLGEGLEVQQVIRLASSQVTSAAVDTAVRKNKAQRRIVGVDEQVIVLTLWYDDFVDVIETQWDLGLDQGRELIRQVDEWNSDTLELSATTRCPWCAEEILAVAKKCKHCGEYLTPGDEANLPAAIVAPVEASSDDHHQCPDCSAVFGSSQEVKAHRTGHSCPQANSQTSAQTVRTGAQPPAVQSGDAAMICPHCSTRGRVRTRSLKVKKGVSGGKATAAILTGGISVLGTGLSRKEGVTEATCGQCGTTWRF
jgi:hypothetical protein